MRNVFDAGINEKSIIGSYIPQVNLDIEYFLRQDGKPSELAIAYYQKV